MHYSAHLENEMPSIKTSLHFEIKITELVPLQVQKAEQQRRPHFFFRQNGSRQKVEDEKHVQLQIPPVNSISTSVRKLPYNFINFFKLHFIPHNQTFLFFPL